MPNQLARFALFAAATAASFGAAFAYKQVPGLPSGLARWQGTQILMRTHGSSFPSGSSARTAITAAVSSWNTAPSIFGINLSHGDTSVGWFNGQNEIWFESSSFFLAGAPAATFNWIAGTRIQESDVMFAAGWPWVMNENKSSLTSYAGVGFPFRSVAVHELGHTLGLDHEANTYNVMGDAATHLSSNGNSARAYPGEDATSGAIAIYGLAGTATQDLGVSHFQYLTSSQGYSAHERTAVTDLLGAQKPSTLVAGEPVFQVGRGDLVNVTFAFENNGVNSQKRTAGYYWSTNNTITTYDNLLVNATPTVSRNTVYMRTQEVEIPDSLNLGQIYYLGVVVDRYDELKETQENNNATYVAIEITD